MRYDPYEEAIIEQVWGEPTVQDDNLDRVIQRELIIAGFKERSLRAIQCKRGKMGLTLDRRPKPTEEWTEHTWELLPEDVDAIEDYVGVEEVFIEPPVDDIIRSYVNEGAGLTQKQLSRLYGIPKKTIRRILRQYGVTKDSLPLSPEEVLTFEEEQAVEQILAQKERRISEKLVARKTEEIERDYLRLLEERLDQERIHSLACELSRSLPDPPRVHLSGPQAAPNGQTWTAHIPTTDEHVGSLVWAPESFGNHYDTHIACDRLKRHAEQAASWILQNPGCQHIYRTLIGDLLHALLGQTEHGTHLDQDTRSAKVMVHLIEALKYNIAVLAGTGVPVTVKGVRGNHDGQMEFIMVMLLLREAFLDNPDVTVDFTPGRYDSFVVGSSLHVLDHGYGHGSPGSTKGQTQAATVAKLQPGYRETKRAYTYLGHLHSLETAAAVDHEIIRLPSFCETDDYETSLRYYNEPAVFFFRLDEEGRIDTVTRRYREHLDV